jgi:hypothetical protein
MFSRVRSAAAIACLSAAGLLGGPLVAPSLAQPNAPCASPTASAQNQYCEDVPTASGGRRHAGGAGGSGPTLGSPGALPRRVARQIDRSPQGSARRKLLQLPASLLQERLGPASSASGWSLALVLALILAGLVLALAALAWYRHRRQAGASGPEAAATS